MVIFKVLAWLPFPSDVLPLSATEGVVRNGKKHCRTSALSLLSLPCKTWQLQFTYTASQPGTHQKIIDVAMNGVGCRASARIMGVGLNTVLRHLKNSRPQSVTSRIQPGSDVIVCAGNGRTVGLRRVLNHVSAGCFTRMTGYGGRLWRTSSVNALWPHWSVF